MRCCKKIFQKVILFIFVIIFIINTHTLPVLADAAALRAMSSINTPNPLRINDEIDFEEAARRVVAGIAIEETAAELLEALEPAKLPSTLATVCNMLKKEFIADMAIEPNIRAFYQAIKRLSIGLEDAHISKSLQLIVTQSLSTMSWAKSGIPGAEQMQVDADENKTIIGSESLEEFGRSLVESLRYTPEGLDFGTSGIRGAVEDMTDLECYINVRGIIEYLKSISEEEGGIKEGALIDIGGDLRHSTDRILKAAAKAIEDSGCRVNNCGRISTPALTYYAMQHGRVCLMVTGSHIPDDRNGIKPSKTNGEVLKQDEKGIKTHIQKIRKQEYEKFGEPGSLFDYDEMFKQAPALPEVDREAIETYVRRYVEIFSANKPLKGKKIVVYEHSSVGTDVLARILEEALGATVIRKGKSSKFVAVDTESVDRRDLDLMEQWAQEEQPFALVSEDGDGDRPWLSDENGKFLRGDLLGLLTALYLNADFACVTASCNDAVDMVLGQKGTKVVRKRIGSPYIIKGMMEAVEKRDPAAAALYKLIVSWEANGGFLFMTDLIINGKVLKALPTRDAVLPLLCALLLANDKNMSLSKLVNTLPKRYVEAERIRNFPTKISAGITRWLSPQDANIDMIRFEKGTNEITISYKDGTPGRKIGEADPLYSELMQKKQLLGKYINSSHNFGEILGIIYTDGVRVICENDKFGDVIHFRPSGNAPEFRCYSNADSEERAKEIVKCGLEKILPAMARDLPPSYLAPSEGKASAREKMLLSVTNRGFCPMPENMKWAVSELEETSFINDRVDESIQCTASTVGHFEGRKLGMVYVPEGKGIMFSVIYDEEGAIKKIYRQDLKAGSWALALPGSVTFMVNLGGLKYDRISMPISPARLSKINPEFDFSAIEHFQEMFDSEKQDFAAPYSAISTGDNYYVMPNSKTAPKAVCIEGLSSIMPQGQEMVGIFRSLTPDSLRQLTQQIIDRRDDILTEVPPERVGIKEVTAKMAKKRAKQLSRLQFKESPTLSAVKDTAIREGGYEMAAITLSELMDITSNITQYSQRPDLEMLHKTIYSDVKQLVYEVSRIMKEYRQGVRAMGEGERKTDGTIALEADEVIQKLFTDYIKRHFPGHIIIAEEGFKSRETRRILEAMEKAEYVWVIDPIDGTHEFQNGKPGEAAYATGIALFRKGKPVFSMVYAPEYDLDGSGSCLFEANEWTEGAFLNGKRMIIENAALSNDKRAIVRYSSRVTKPPALDKLSESCKVEVSEGGFSSGFLLLLSITRGGLSDCPLYIQSEPAPWDMAQAAYILQKAGGTVTDTNGNDIFPLLPQSYSIDVRGKPRMPVVVAGTIAAHSKYIEACQQHTNLLFRLKQFLDSLDAAA